MLKMKFPLPELSNHKFTICVHPLPDAPNGIRKHQHFYDNGICHGCDKTHVRTCKVGDLPNLCQPCYDWMKRYSHMDDPYHITRMRAGTPIEDELVKKAIRYAKVKTADTTGLVSMSTGAILLHAYKAYRDALDEGASEEEARERKAYIELQEEMHRQAEVEEEARVQEHRQELLRKMRENQRIIDAQQARLNRLSGNNGIKRDVVKHNAMKCNMENTVPKKQEVRTYSDEEEAPRKKSLNKAIIIDLLKENKLTVIMIIVCLIFLPQFRYGLLLAIVVGLMSVGLGYIEQITKWFK